MAPSPDSLMMLCRYRRYVIEDRWEAIRWAIGSAQTDDCVVIVGRGHKDYVDWRFDEGIARVSALQHACLCCQQQLSMCKSSAEQLARTRN